MQLETNTAIVMKTKCLLYLSLFPILLGGCVTDAEPDPVGAEAIYSSDHELAGYTDKEGYRLVFNEELYNCLPHYYALYTPANNLKLILACCSECGELSGYKVNYETDGSIREVVAIEDVVFSEIEEEPFPERVTTRILKKWVKDQDLEGVHYAISRDDSGIVTAIGDIDVPRGYSASYFITEWGEFWTSDIRGGKLGFFVQLKEDDKEGRSTVDYLYYDGRLVAEHAYWNGVPIKSLSYDRDGHFMGIKDESNGNGDVLWDVWENYNFKNPPAWYLNTDRD